MSPIWGSGAWARFVGRPGPLPELEELRQPKAGESRAAAVVVTVDFGTSKTAVHVLAGDQGRLAWLDKGRAVPHPVATAGALISSRAAWVSWRGARRVLLGQEAWTHFAGLMKQLGKEVKPIGRVTDRERQVEARRYASLKRLLYDKAGLGATGENLLRSRLMELLREVLALALRPVGSQTFELLNQFVEETRAADELRKQFEAYTRWLGTEAGVGDLRPHMVRCIVENPDAPVRLCLCVPNSLAPEELALVTGAAREAANEVLGSWGEAEGFEPPRVHVTTVREAEAAVIGYAVGLRRSGRGAAGFEPGKITLCLDVGAGTTDAALVMWDQGTETPTLLARSGVPVGGDDLDALLLCLALLGKHGANPMVGRDALEGLDWEDREELLGKAAEAKVDWSGKDHVAWQSVLDRVMGGADGLRFDTLGEEGSEASETPIVVSLDLETQTIQRPCQTLGYAGFLRYVVRGAVEPLMEIKDAWGLDVAQVLLSGQGSLAPGVREVVQRVVGAEPVSPDDPLGRKLICVRGAAHLAASGIGSLGSEVLSESLSVNLTTEKWTLLAPRGCEASDGIDAALAWHDFLRREAELSRDYCSDSLVPEGAHWWVRRVLAKLSRQKDDRFEWIAVRVGSSRRPQAWGARGAQVHEIPIVRIPSAENLQVNPVYLVDAGWRWRSFE